MKKGIYEHYKGKRYEVIDTVRHSESEELFVLYRALYAEHGLWVRPFTMFFENVEVEGKILPRFALVEEKYE